MDLFLPILVIFVLITTCLATKCPANYTALAQKCMEEVNERFAESVPHILAKDKHGVAALCKKYQEFFYCLHDVLDPCEDLGAHYFGVLHKVMEHTVGKYCPETDSTLQRVTEPTRRRVKKPSSDQFTLRSSSGVRAYSNGLLSACILSWILATKPLI